MKKSIFILPLLMLALSGCFPASGTFSAEPANFFNGVWHGWIAPISLLMNVLADPKVRIYEPNNVGIAYDLGFYIAIISGFGGISIFRRKK
jgi:hypothetical protein